MPYEIDAIAQDSQTCRGQLAQRVADYTAFLYVDTGRGGRTGYLVEYRPTAELFGDPREEHTREYLRGEFG